LTPRSSTHWLFTGTPARNIDALVSAALY